MRINFVVVMCLAVAGNVCAEEKPSPSAGPGLTDPRTELTVSQLHKTETLRILDMSYFARPEWAKKAEHAFSGSISFGETQMLFPLDREHHPAEDQFPAFMVDFIAHRGELIPRHRGLIDTRESIDGGWDVIVGTGKVWSERGDKEWSRASFPLNLTDRYVGAVRNCVATFVYTKVAVSNTYVQCSQETADIEDKQIGDIRAMVPATYQARMFPDANRVIDAYKSSKSRRIPVVPLSAIDNEGEIADYFNKSIWSNASTSLGAVYMDGTLYVNPPQTRHGTYPYPAEMRHGVYSVTKSLAGALTMFFFAERYGEEIFDEFIADHVPAFAERPEWQGVTFSHALDMATGTRGGEGPDLLFRPLMSAAAKEDAINNIARLGDGPNGPGEAFNYATTNYFVLSYALQNYVEKKEGAGVRYWDLVRENVLEPIGAKHLNVLHTRDEDPEKRIPALGYGARPTLDEAAKITLLIFNEGEYEGQQILNRNKIREALGRTKWGGYAIGWSIWPAARYRHSFWSKHFWAGWCRVHVPYMEGHGTNHVLLLPSGALVFRFMDEFDWDLETLVRSVERIKSSC